MSNNENLDQAVQIPDAYFCSFVAFSHDTKHRPGNTSKIHSWPIKQYLYFILLPSAAYQARFLFAYFLSPGILDILINCIRNTKTTCTAVKFMWATFGIKLIHIKQPDSIPRTWLTEQCKLCVANERWLVKYILNAFLYGKYGSNERGFPQYLFNADSELKETSLSYRGVHNLPSSDMSTS